MRATFGAVGLAALLALGPALAAGASPPKPQTAAAPAPPPQEPPPPYEPQLLRIAEIMGALAYLRDLCGQKDGADFRAKMAALLDAEGVEGQRRDLLAGAFNKGFRDYAASYRLCGPAANAVIERYLAETAHLAAEVAGRFGS